MNELRFAVFAAFDDEDAVQMGRVSQANVRHQTLDVILRRWDEPLDEAVDRRDRQTRFDEPEGELASFARVQATLNKERDALEAAQEWCSHRGHRMTTDRHRLRVGEHPAVR